MEKLNSEEKIVSSQKSKTIIYQFISNFFQV